MRRFFVKPNDINLNTATLSGQEFSHITKVLRCKPDDACLLLDGLGYEYTAKIDEINEDNAVLSISSKTLSLQEPETKVTLYQGMPKNLKLDTIVQKCVELGVHSIVPFISKRCVKVPDKNFAKKLDRLEKIATEAVKQCKRAIVPQVLAPVDFKTLVKHASQHTLGIICYEDEHKTTLRHVLTTSDAKDIAVIIGPEGGFDEQEVNVLMDNGIKPATLGKRILRTETAGLAALAQIMYEKETK